MMDDSKLLTTYVEAHDKWVAETNPTSVAVAEAAWDEGFAYRHGLPENDTLLSDAEIGNPYREGTP